ncbi:DUF5994 family protein [Streptomyces lincolnensis]|uniref:DUF5994 family protein n=2 Tax=Streptomyces lincolnensis TaxID=1915 RepID=UPI00083410A9|nr:DUF5994 family protein [Streptomyces lincolnensis]
MSAPLTHLPFRPVPYTAPAARLMLRSESPSGGQAPLDGAWWPGSRDLPGEFSALTDGLDPRWGRITRIAVNPRNWPILPPRIFVNGHVVKVGWFTSELDPHSILLLSHAIDRRTLLVVPPETDESSAARLMHAASADTGPPMTATALLTAELVGRQGPEATAAEATEAAEAAADGAFLSYGRYQRSAVGTVEM